MFTIAATSCVNTVTMVKRYTVKVVPVIGALAMTFYIATLAYLQVLSRVRLRELPAGSDTPTLQRPSDDARETVYSHDARHVLQSWDQDYYVNRNSTLPQHSREFHNKTCHERSNFVFIKCMKCATETMGTLLRRFGYTRNLSFVIPVGKNIYLGWPYKMTKKDYRRNRTREFNVLIEHSIYDRDFMRALMPSDAAYVTIIREPYSHFQSVFYYFNVVNIAKVPTPEPINEYLKHIYRYDTTYRRHDAAPLRYCIPDNFSITKNLLSYCMGLPLGFPNGTRNITTNITEIQSHLVSLEKDFTLVMLVEYFLESLILLKRLMCWTAKDIIHHSVNILNYADKTQPPPQDNVDIYKKWSSVDYLLYDHFYRVFWRKVREQTSDFFDEVKQFRQTHSRVMYYCYKTTDAQDLTIPQTQWDAAFNFTRYECDLMSSYLLDKIKDRYEKM